MDDRSASSVASEGAAQSGATDSDFEVERVDALAVVSEISEVLLAAWPAPAVHYTVEMLRWQFTFPGPPARGALARVRGVPAAFVGFAARRVRCGGEASPSYATAFLGVLPSLRGAGTATRVYDPMIAMACASGIPCVGFVDVKTPAARRLLVKHTGAHGMELKSLRLCKNWGFVDRGGAAPPPPAGSKDDGPAPARPYREAAGPEEVLDVIEACRDADTLWAAPDREMLLHYLRDPRGRKVVVVEEGRRVTAAAMVLLSEVTSQTGVERVAMVDCVWMPEPEAPRVRALFQAAGAVFAGRSSTRVIGAPNLCTIDEGVLKAAGLRPAAAVYEPFVYQNTQSVFTNATATNQEMV